MHVTNCNSTMKLKKLKYNLVNKMNIEFNNISKLIK
jgi:hypothetical protein